MRLIVTISSLALGSAVLAACMPGSATTAPVETITPAEPDANPLDDDPDEIPLNGSEPHTRGFA